MQYVLTPRQGAFGLGETPKEGAWPPYFFAVRDDVIETAGGIARGDTLETFFERLNKVLLNQ